jgi:flagellin-like protein
MKKLLKSKKALSPVVAAIILIAVTVAVSIAVAAWMGALTFTFMQTEEVTYTSYSWGANNANITLVVQNTGSGALTLSAVQVGGVAVDSPSITPAALEPGDSSTIVVTQAFTSGIKYEFTVITAKGNAFGPYIKTAP